MLNYVNFILESKHYTQQVSVTKLTYYVNKRGIGQVLVTKLTYYVNKRGIGQVLVTKLTYYANKRGIGWAESFQDKKLTIN